VGGATSRHHGGASSDHHSQQVGLVREDIDGLEWSLRQGTEWSAHDQQEHTRKVLRTVLAGDANVRLFGVLLLVIGLGVATAANVLSVTI
jgi:hypothetical protein